ncbi:FecR family protein [Xanthobacter sp. KR7-65]|uniref:FecR family protein n=1 Tax=Xanthobacter sp. KR7-65 TaxID=3156612 RepID=UPI0032B48FF1
MIQPVRAPAPRALSLLSNAALSNGGAAVRLSRRALLAAMAAGLVPGALHAADPAGAVEAVTGPGTAERDGRSVNLAPGDALFVGDTILTGEAARLAMRLGRTTQVRLGGRTRLRIDRFLVDRGGVFTLGSGAMLYDRPEGAPAPDSQVDTPYGRLVVRGTRFFAGPVEGLFGVFVARGAVEVTGGGTTVALGPGQGTDIGMPGLPPSPPRTWSEARIRAALALVAQ